MYIYTCVCHVCVCVFAMTAPPPYDNVGGRIKIQEDTVATVNVRKCMPYLDVFQVHRARPVGGHDVVTASRQQCSWAAATVFYDQQKYGIFRLWVHYNVSMVWKQKPSKL